MIFVTGGTGLIGAHLLYKLVSAEKKVKALKRSTSNMQQVLRIFSYYTDNPEPVSYTHLVCEGVQPAAECG